MTLDDSASLSMPIRQHHQHILSREKVGGRAVEELTAREDDNLFAGDDGITNAVEVSFSQFHFPTYDVAVPPGPHPLSSLQL